jgi:hypothetical protein
LLFLSPTSLVPAGKGKSNTRMHTHTHMHTHARGISPTISLGLSHLGKENESLRKLKMLTVNLLFCRKGIAKTQY